MASGGLVLWSTGLAGDAELFGDFDRRGGWRGMLIAVMIVNTDNQAGASEKRNAVLYRRTFEEQAIGYLMIWARS